MKAEKKPKGPSHKQLYSRISYLHQAATHLMNARRDQAIAPVTINGPPDPGHVKTRDQSLLPNAQAPGICEETLEILPTLAQILATTDLRDALGPTCHLISHLRSVSLKGQIRLSPAMKHSICKRCDSLLVPGSTSSVRLENKSRGGKKPWANVLIVTCCLCSAVKRFPVGAKKQCRRPQREGDTNIPMAQQVEMSANGT
jgi:ribonuclease P protein subunit RPR2